jgi:hypothetical protein
LIQQRRQFYTLFLVSCLSFLSFSYHAPTTTTFATFYGSEGRLGQAFLTGAGLNRSLKSVHNLIVSTGIPVTAPKMRKQFGHAVTQTTAKSMKGTPTFQNPAELQITMQQQIQT